MKNKKVRSLISGVLTLTMAAGLVLAAGGSNSEAATAATFSTVPDGYTSGYTGGEDTIEDLNSTGTLPVYARYGATDIVYALDVEWGAMTFKYDDGNNDGQIWTTDSLYTGKTVKAGWYPCTEKGNVKSSTQDDINKIFVRNVSNAKVAVAYSFNPAEKDSVADATEWNGQFIDGSKTALAMNYEKGKDSAPLSLAICGLESARFINGTDTGTIKYDDLSADQKKSIESEVYFLPTNKPADGQLSSTAFKKIGTITVGLYNDTTTAANAFTTS